MMGDDEYRTWIAPLSVLDKTDASLTLTTDNAIVGDWVRDHLLRDIETVARSHFGAEFRILINWDEDAESGIAQTDNNGSSAMTAHPYNPGFTFDPGLDFVDPDDGVYDIWIASFFDGDFFSGKFSITEIFSCDPLSPC